MLTEFTSFKTQILTAHNYNTNTMREKKRAEAETKKQNTAFLLNEIN